MHELSICRSIVDIVARKAAGREVRTVHVRIGVLRQIVPDTLVYCWSLVNDGTALAGAALEVESVPAAIRCRDCEAITTLADAILLCSACDGANVEITTGEEFLLTNLDLAEA